MDCSKFSEKLSFEIRSTETLKVNSFPKIRSSGNNQ